MVFPSKVYSVSKVWCGIKACLFIAVRSRKKTYTVCTKKKSNYLNKANRARRSPLLIVKICPSFRIKCHKIQPLYGPDHLYAPLQVPTVIRDQSGLVSLNTAPSTQTLTSSGAYHGEMEGKGGYGSSLAIFWGAAR